MTKWIESIETPVVWAVMVERREFIKTVANVYLSPARLQQIEEEEEVKKK